MTLEFAERLSALRKERGYSQEELAERLGVSRQAISKWERGETAPDTDNLIALANLYGVSMDELVQGRSRAKQRETVHIGFDGIHVENERESVHVGFRGIHVEDANGKWVDIGEHGVRVKDGKGHCYDFSSEPRWKRIVDAVIPLVAVAVFVLWGFLGEAWHPAWLVFLGVPIFCSLIHAVEHKDGNLFAWPVLVTLVYLCFGFFAGLWHPLWILYLTVPLYYILIKALKKG